MLHLLLESSFHFNEKFKYQAVPSLRIQYPGAQTVNFHNDIMYGHGQDIVNIWVPLVPVYDSKSMYVIDETNSISLNKSLKNNEWSISELNKACIQKAKPLKMDYGQYFIFHTWILHGTKENLTDETRVSFDARILPNNGDYGLKDQSFFVKEPIVKSNTKQKQAAIYMHNYAGFTKNISTRYQSVLCQRYAENNNLRIYCEETEIRTVNHQPNLYDLCFGTYKSSFGSIIMISLLLLPNNKSKMKDFLRKVHFEGIDLHFVLDDFVFNKNESVTKAMNIYGDLYGIHQG